MFYRILATLTLSFVFYIGTSQISYHRLYETSLNDPINMMDTIFYHMNSTTDAGDVFAMGTKRVGDPINGFDDLSVIFTKHNDKGNIDWSKELDFGVDSVDIVAFGKLQFNGTLDSLLFTIDVDINGERTEVFGRLPKSGAEISLQTVKGNQVQNSTFAFPNLAPFVTFSDLLVTPGEQTTISRIGVGNELIWSRAYEFLNSDGDNVLSDIIDIKTTLDSTIVIVGNGEGIGDEYVVAELDSNGVQLWAEAYTFDTPNLLTIAPREIIALEDGNFATLGTYITSGGPNTHGFVTIIDSSGNVVLSKTLLVDENLASLGNGIQADNGTLWLSGISSINDTSSYFTTNMDLNGLINWTTYYPSEGVGLSAYSTSLLPVNSTGGATLIGHGFKDDLAVMQVMKHDSDGTTPCSDTTSTILEDLTVVADTLMEQVTNGGIFFDTLTYEFDNFNGFTPPVLSITQYAPFCPNEEIDTILVATVSRISEENISYLWSTGEINDTIRVTEEGQYSVTVTITEDICFTMCDTVELTRLMVPQVDISVDNSRFCEENIIVLTGNYTPGANNQTYLWNTGETTPSIEIMDPGVYSVTVTDACGEMAMDDTDVSLPVFDPVAIFGPNLTEFCETGEATITAAYSGGGNEPVFTWSDGQVGNPITVTTEGEYTLTVTDECDLTTIVSGEVIFPEIATEAEIVLTPNCNEDDPFASTLTFEATGSGDIELLTYTVDDEGVQTLVAQTNPTNILQLNSYIVFARNICGETLDSLSVNATAICGGLIQFPIVFFPNGEDEQSKTFGPIPIDTMDVDRISDVEFKVFNRWGETVFESTEILDAWDGTHKGEPAPSEVYIYYLTYILDERQMLAKGDVTLVR